MRENYNNYSKNMKNDNNKSFNKKEETKNFNIEYQVETETVEAIETDTTEINETVEVKEAVEPEEVKETFKIGVVSNCKRLHVRLEPSKESESISIIDSDTEVDVLEDSDPMFYKVRVNNIEGYCMKKFIAID